MSQALYVLTSFGTVLGFEPGGDTLCQLSVSAWADAAAFTLSRNALDVRGPDGTLAVFGVALRALREPAAGTVTSLAVHWLDNGRIALEHGGRFLCAEPDGRATLSRWSVDRWESFLLLDAAQLRFITQLLGNDWLVHLSGEIVERQQITRDDDFNVSFGTQKCRVPELLELNPQSDGGGEALSACIMTADFRMERIHLFRPLIYFAACGADGIFESLRLSLESLNRVAGWRYDVAVITDRTPEALSEYIPAAFAGRLRTLHVSGRDVLDYALARYHVAALPAVAGYQPLFYADIDIVFDQPLERLMADIVRTGKLCFFAEGTLDQELDFYGLTLFNEDGGLDPHNQPAFSTGAIGIPNIARAAAPFRALVSFAERYAGKRSRQYFSMYDQPYANYVFRKSVDFDLTVLNRYENYRNGIDAVPEESKGFVHFAGGVGNFEPKLVRMARYLARLS